MKTWSEFFEGLKSKEYFISLNNFLEKEYSSYIIYPPKEKIYNAFELTPLNEVKVVVVGQDPYHEPNQAIGLAFAVSTGITLPPSLKNIYKEISAEYGKDMRNDGDLTYLSRQGVLLLNAILSVRKGQPLSHNIDEYKKLLGDVLTELDKQDQTIVFLLWGGFAKKLKKYIKNPNHYILEANHPSPLSANRGGWFGCNHFVKTNEILKENNLKEIDWVN